MGQIIFWLVMAFLIFVYVAIEHGLVEVLYVALYFGAYLVLAKGLLYLYRKAFKAIRKPITITGRVVSTAVVKKSSVRGGLGRGSTPTSPIITTFNCIDVLTEDGKLYRIFESYNDEVEEEYDGKIEKGKMVEMTIRKCDSKFFIEEDVFMRFFGIKRLEMD